MSFGKFRYRSVTAVVIMVMLLVLAGPNFLSSFKVHAVDGQITSRSIQMGDDSSNTSGGTTKYQVTFKPYTSATIYGVIVDFCNTDPIPGDVCTAPTGFSDYVTTASASNVSGLSGTWVAAQANSGRTFEYTNASGQSMPTSTAVSFAINNVTNPTVVGTFYARIFTFNSNSGAGSATQWLTTANGTDITNDFDYGGIALSVAATINVTSKVQEQITFCVYISSCGTAATVNLGDSHDVLSTTAPAVASGATYGVFYSLSTNASNGAVVYLKGATLTSGANTIPAAGATPYLYSGTNNDFFGLCSYNSAVTVGSAPTIPSSEYQGTSNGGTCSGLATLSDVNTTQTTAALGATYATFGFNSTNTTSTYGDELAAITAPGASVNAVVLAAGVSVTQASGVYTTTLQLIATGTY